MFLLAETLNKPVYELEEHMPMSEYMKWSIFFQQRDEDSKKQQQAGGGRNLLALDDPEALIKGLTG